MFDKNPLTKIAFVVATLIYSISVFTVETVAIIEIVAWVFILLFFSLVLRAETLGEIGKGLVEALKGKWSK